MSLIAANALSDRILGLLAGIVVDNKDPEAIGRIKVKYAVPSGDVEAAWARQITIMGGPEMGFVCFPEVDDEVLLRFVNGQPDQPVIVGSVHNGKDKIPFDNADGKNDDRIWWSRSIHKMTIHDGDGAEHMTVETKDGKTKWAMVTPDKLIALTTTKDIVIKAAKNMLFDAGADVSMTADMTITQAAGSNFEVKAGSNVDIKGSAGVAITSSAVSFKA